MALTAPSVKSLAPAEAVSQTLGWAVLAVGILMAAASLYIGISAYTPVLFADVWGVPMDYFSSGGHYGIAKLWAQHNEHRIPFQKLLQLADMFWWKTDQRPLLAAGWLVQVAQCCAFAYFLRRTAKFSPTESVTALGLVVLCVLNPIQLQIFTWAISPCLLASFFFAVLSFGFLALYAGSAGDTAQLILSVVCAFLSECNFASGVLVFAMLPACALLLMLRARLVALLVGCGVVGIGIYLIGYHSPPNATSPLEGIRHPFEVAAFGQAYFSESWRYIAPRFGNFATAGAVVLMLLVALHHLTVRRQRREPAEAFLLTLAWMMMVTALITALGRQSYGLAQAREGRYQVAAMLFWCCAGIWLLLQARALNRFRTYAIIALQVSILLAAVSEASALPQFLRINTADRYARDLAGLSYEAGVFDYPVVRGIYPYPPAVPVTYQFLLAKHWIDPPFHEYQDVGKQLTQVYTTPADEKCSGYVDHVVVITDSPSGRGIEADGWVYFDSPGTHARTVLAVDEGSRIAGIGLAGGQRPDVLAALPSAASLNTGWRLYAVYPPGAKQLSVYAVVPGTNRACLIPGVKAVP